MTKRLPDLTDREIRRIPHHDLNTMWQTATDTEWATYLGRVRAMDGTMMRMFAVVAVVLGLAVLVLGLTAESWQP